MPPFIKRLLVLLSASLMLLYGLNKMHLVRHDWLDTLASRCAYPWYALSGSISNKVTSWQQDSYAYDVLKERYDKLQHDYIQALDELIALKAEQHVYEQTKELAAFAKRYQLDGTMAHIMVKNIDDASHYYLVNAGSNKGIKKDMVAIYQHHLVGRVVEVYPWYSKVLLITDEKSKIAAYTSKTHAPGIVQGYNDATRCNFTYVSHLFSVVDHDLIISSGQGQVYPQGFCLGKIRWHNIKAKELYHHIELQPMINLPGLSYVLLIDPATIIQF